MINNTEDEKEKLDWENAKKIDDTNDNNDTKVEKINLEEKLLEKGNKKLLIPLIILVILLFLFGILIGRRLMMIDEDIDTYKKPKYVPESKVIDNTEVLSEANVIVENVLQETNEKEYNEDEEESMIVYARYNIEEPNDNNKECEITFGKESNFSFDLGKNGAYIYGNYHIDGNTITCNAITWRNSEKIEPINSIIIFRVIEKEIVQITDVQIYDGNEGLDQELINLDGLKVGYRYVYEKK